MTSVINNFYTVIESHQESIKKLGLTGYLFERLKERNPFEYSSGYKKEVKNLYQRLKRLKIIKQDSYRKIKQAPAVSLDLQRRISLVSQTLFNIEQELTYLKQKENLQTLLKLTSPLNLIVPGCGDVLRITAYTLKLLNATIYCIQECSHDEIKKVIKEISLAGSLTVASQFMYERITSLKKYLSFSSFRSLISYQ